MQQIIFEKCSIFFKFIINLRCQTKQAPFAWMSSVLLKNTGSQLLSQSKNTLKKQLCGVTNYYCYNLIQSRSFHLIQIMMNVYECPI